MSQARATREHQCERCGKGFTSLMRLQNYLADEYAVKTLKGIRMTRYVGHAMRGGSE